MSWTTMHFAVGMACGGALSGVACLIVRRGWRGVPIAMTLGGVWANVPDMPRLWRVDFPWLPGGRLGSLELERFLHEWGDLFFFHHTMDLRMRGNALLGLALLLVMYNAVAIALLWQERRQRLRAERAMKLLEAERSDRAKQTVRLAA